MRRLKRFLLTQNPNSEIVQLDKGQSYHLRRVLRLKPGQPIEVFTREGIVYRAEILNMNETQAQIRLLNYPVGNSPMTAKNLRPEITLATAIPKGSRMDNLVEQVSELGLNRLVPINTQRSVVIAPSGQTNKFNRWKRIAIESAKQSQQQTLTEITDPLSFPDALKEVKNYDIAFIGALDSSNALSDIIKSYTQAQKILYFIGPEGDFTPEELQLAVAAGIKPVLLPINGVLRVETAAVVMLSMLLYAYTQPALVT